MSKTIHLSWDGASDDKGITAYELMYALAPGFNNWQQAAVISTTQSANISYDFVTTNYVDHKFSIRTIDTIGQYSDYKYVTQTIAPVTTFISTTSSSILGTCGNPAYTPSDIINIYSGASLIGNTNILSGNIVKTEGNLTFNGYGRNWSVLHYDKSYNCIINSSGNITSSISCSEPPTIPVTPPPPPTFVEVSNVTIGSGSSRTREQTFEVGSVITLGAIYSLMVYSHGVYVSTQDGDTASTIAQKMTNAINNTTAAQWNNQSSAPASGTPGFKPTATVYLSNKIKVILNWSNQFGSNVTI
jgi:hypothetical protein